jgi:hypothetical protein
MEVVGRGMVFVIVCFEEGTLELCHFGIKLNGESI